MTITTDNVVGSLFSAWGTIFPLGTLTGLPGQMIEARGMTEWIELHVSGWSERPARAQSVPLVDVTIVAHGFVKTLTNLARVDQIADALRTALSNRQIDVSDYSQSGNPVVGLLRLQEANVHHLTLGHQQRGTFGLQQVIVTAAGIVEGV